MRKAYLLLLWVTSMFVFAGRFSLLKAQGLACGTDRLLNEWRKDSAFRLQEKKMNEAILSVTTSKRQKKVNAPTPLPDITLPVVFHLAGSGAAALTDAQVAAIISDLNDAFSNKGAYAGQGANTHIQFKLAQKDPDGGITNGITRTNSYFDTHMNTPIEDHKLKYPNYWDPDRYINIWYITSIDDEIYAEFSCGVWRRSTEAGHANLPASSDPKHYQDGIVVTGSGALLAHEMGHYLGLYHTFEGYCTNNNCATDGDRVCDTPPDGSKSASPCSNPSNSCSSDTLSNHSNGFFPLDVRDPVRNFMDYNGCPTEFTQGQAERMQDAVTALRSTLLNNGVLTKPCNENISVAFTRDNTDPIFNTPVKFTSSSSGTITSYQWTVDGGSVLETAADFSYTFPTAGNNPRPKYKVTLKAIGSTPGCFASYTDWVMPNCGITARFYNNKTNIAAKAGFLLDTILFTNNTVNNLGGNVSLKWSMTLYQNNNVIKPWTIVTSNVSGAGVSDLNYSFDAPGLYRISLSATNGGCTDSTDYLYLSVQDPTPDLTVYPSFARCSQQTKLRLQFSICNNGYAPVKPGIPVTFYDSDPTKSGARQVGSIFNTPDSLLGYCCNNYSVTLDVGRPRLDTLFAVVNDVGGMIPIALPNNNTYIERSYTNNTGSITNFRFRVSTNPGLATLEPGDAQPLVATTFPDIIPYNSYTWSTAYNLSCSSCQATILVADTTQTKRVIAISPDLCIDTAYVEIKVPPADDYTVAINNFSCAGGDSLTVNFKISNTFPRGTIPKNLRVAFYVADSSNRPAVLIAPVFIVPATVQAAQQTFNAKIKKPLPGNIFAVVNDTATTLPIVLPNTSFLEKNYNNNTALDRYQPVSSVIDTTVCTGDTVYGYTESGLYTTLFTTAVGGCDSIRILNLHVRPQTVTRTVVNISICQGNTYEGYKQSGTYVNVFKGVNACDSIRTLNLTVNSLPATPQVTAAGNPGICPGSSLLLTSNATNGNQWLLNGTPIQGATNNTYAATVAGDYSVRISDGCTSTASPPITISLFTLPPTPAVTAGGPLVFCPSGNVTLSSSAVAGNQWYLNGTAISNAKNQTFTASLAGNYTVRVTDPNACVSAASAATTVTIQPAPATPVVTASGPVSFCPGGSVSLVSSAGTANQWMLNGVAIPNATGQTFSANTAGNYTVQTTEGSVCASLPSAAVAITVFATKNQTNDVIICKGNSYFAGGKQQTVSGTYKDILKTYQGCDSIVTTNLYVSPLPAHFLPADTVACIGAPYDLLVSYPTVNWSTGSIGPAISITQPGAYSAQVIDRYGCKGGDTINVGFKYCITIQPPDAFTPNNDGKNDVYKPLIGAPVTNYHLQIFNRWGQVVFDTKDQNKGWNGNFGGGPEPAGTYVYLISLVDQNGSTVVKKGTMVLIR